MLIMSPINYVDESTLPERAAKLLQALRAKPDQWLTRPDLADLTGKRNLSPNDQRHLEGLTSAGLIEAKQQPGEVRWQWVYRAKPGV